MDSNGSIIWKPEPEVSNYSSISGAVGLSASRADSPTTPFGPMGADNSKHYSSPFVNLIKLVKKGSYVSTLIVMMTWSITYHSWLSFILLLWSCTVWMIPNSRQACLKSSPALVLFALGLLIGQYVYSLNLNDDELPITVGTVSMSEIGFKKYFDISYQPLFIKILYTIMFWITLKQYLEEKETEKRKQFAQGVMLQPFNITFSTGQPGAPPHDLRRQMSLATTTGTNQSPIVLWLTNLLKDLLVKYWIWIVTSMLMVMSLSGDRVVLFRIVYMALFLSFVLLFQVTSFSTWRRLMYPFWLIVIIYSMVILTAMYTYQFNNFPDYWRDYLFINKELQEDLGLLVYDHDAWILFKELFTPTFFLIITIIQVHFLHNKFLEFSDYERQCSSSSPTSTTIHSAPEESSQANNAKTANTNDIKLDIESENESSNDTSTPNTIKSLNKSSSPQSVVLKGSKDSPTKCSSLGPKGSSVAKEEHSRPESKTEQKEYKSSLEEITELLEMFWQKLQPIVDMEYIILILILVFRSVVIIRQNVYRMKHNESPPPTGVVFPRVGRKDADRDLKGLTMFLINYCFYKFGVEI
ncbi:unnamed protein product [Medioppia subpectinata]|uniref:Piezo TM1-24 domain-containing protein n=1 Tax=Medioppia subpectinata TaxID=1979941 RepID=A0A7R9L235_9ACAR|nr:unnamed protein product [Medioppia subpectinata]CAG2112964.1 unnamed protein product [Medioppia subpectinata]